MSEPINLKRSGQRPSAFAAWFLGALLETVKAVRGEVIAVGVQSIIADPRTRDDAQRQRALDRRGQTFAGGGTAAGDIKIVLADEWGAAAPTGPIAKLGAVPPGHLPTPPGSVSPSARCWPPSR